jgi:hypothetical protein
VQTAEQRKLGTEVHRIILAFLNGPARSLVCDTLAPSLYADFQRHGVGCAGAGTASDHPPPPPLPPPTYLIKGSSVFGRLGVVSTRASAPVYILINKPINERKLITPLRCWFVV